MNGRLINFEIGCRDTAKAAEFYHHAFGWTTSPYMGTSLHAHAPGHSLPGHFTSLGHEPHNYVMLYIEVDDIVDALAKVTDAGGQKIVGPIPLPDGSKFAWAKDPDGNPIGLLMYK